MIETPESAGVRLNQLLHAGGLPGLEAEQSRRFEAYLSLLMRWNARTNLTAIRDQEGILARHFVESIACVHALPVGIANLLDFGSGAGFPGIPIAICRAEIEVTLAESQGKKAAFLQEAVRVLSLRAKVHSGRAEALAGHFDCVVLRAVERMQQAVRMAAGLVKTSGWLAVMTTGPEVAGLQSATGVEFSWSGSILLPGSEDRVIALATRKTGMD
jgi:16S rRNA (guanine527-N7)-methyltransferase